MNIFKRYQAVRSLCEYNFCDLRNTIVELERTGRRNGFSSPAAQLTIKNTNHKGEYDVAVNLCYQLNNNQFETITKDLHIYSFSYIPSSISNILSKEKELKITFTQSDVEEFMANKDLSVSTSGNTLSALLDATLAKTSHTAQENLQIVIRDYVLYYRVIVNLRDNQDKDCYLTEFLTSAVKGIPESELQKLESNHEIHLLIRHHEN